MHEDELAKALRVFGLDNAFDADELRIVAALELRALVENKSQAVGHPRAEVPPGLAENHGQASGHILAGVVADAFDHRDGAAVADRESFAGAPGGEQPPCGRSVERGVPEDDVFSRSEAASVGWPDDDIPSPHPLSDVVVRFTFQNQPDPVGQKRAETLPGAPRKAEFRRGAFQAPVAAPLGHHSRGPRAEGEGNWTEYLKSFGGRLYRPDVAPASASINFNDPEPSLISSKYSRNETFKVRYLVEDPLFRVDACQVRRGQRFYLRSASLQILGLLRGRMAVTHAETTLALKAGEFCLLPACLGRVALTAESRLDFLHIQVT